PGATRPPGRTAPGHGRPVAHSSTRPAPSGASPSRRASQARAKRHFARQRARRDPEDGGDQSSDQTRNTLQGADSPLAWTVTGNDAGRVDQTFGAPVVADFTNVGNLLGGGAADTFSLKSAPTNNLPVLSGRIDGGRERDDQGQPVALNTIIGPDVAATWVV